MLNVRSPLMSTLADIGDTSAIGAMPCPAPIMMNRLEISENRISLLMICITVTLIVAKQKLRVKS